MDELTFQKELQLLKRRVAELGARSPISGQPVQSQHESGCVQVDGHEPRDNTRQSDIHDCSRTEVPVSAHPSIIAGANEDQATSSLPFPHGPAAMPTTPAFWQLFEALRGNVRELGYRMTAAEQTLMDLEDRVERMEPSQMTPATSVASLDFSPCVSSPPEVSSADYVVSQEQRNRMIENAVDVQKRAVSNVLRLLNDQGEKMQTHLTRLDEEHTALKNAFTTFQGGSDGNASRNPASVECSQHIVPTPGNGVQFRDREISRLEELLRNAQEALKYSDQEMADRDEQIATFRSDEAGRDRFVRDMEAMTIQKQKELGDALAISGSHERTIQELKTTCNVWRDFSARQGEEIHRHRKDLASQDSQLAHLQAKLNEERRDSNKIIAGRDSHIRELKEFCEKKSMLVREQEDIIARGAQLIESRDEELAVVCRRLRAAEDDKRHERRENARLTRLLMERDNLIAGLRCDLADLQGDSVNTHAQHQRGRERGATSVRFDDSTVLSTTQRGSGARPTLGSATNGDSVRQPRDRRQSRYHRSERPDITEPKTKRFNSSNAGLRDEGSDIAPTTDTGDATDKTMSSPDSIRTVPHATVKSALPYGRARLADDSQSIHANTRVPLAPPLPAPQSPPRAKSLLDLRSRYADSANPELVKRPSLRDFRRSPELIEVKSLQPTVEEAE